MFPVVTNQLSCSSIFFIFKKHLINLKFKNIMINTVQMLFIAVNQCYLHQKFFNY